MKRIIVASLLLLLSACVSSTPRADRPSPMPIPLPTDTLPLERSPKPTSLAPPWIVWERQLDNHGNADMAWEVAETSHRDLLLVGITGPTPCQLGCNWDGWVVKIDAQGNTLWTRQFGGNGADLLTSVILQEDYYVAVGSKYVFPQARQAWVLEMDSHGNLVWEKTLGGNQDDSGVGIVAAPDGGFFVIGQTKSFGTRDGKSDVWLIRLSASGDTLWTKTYDLGDEDMGTWILPFQSGKYIITAVTCTAACGGLNQQGFATYLVIDAAGNVQKTKTFAEGPKNKFRKIKPTLDGGAVIVGATSMEEKFPSEDAWVIKLDANGEVSWTRILRSYGRYDGGFDIVQTSEGGYVMAAYSQIEQTPEMNFDNFWMVGLNSAGDVVWTKTWGGPDNDDLYAVIPTSDGGLVFAGFKGAVSWPLNAIPGAADFYVMKTTANGAHVFLPALAKLCTAGTVSSPGEQRASSE